MSLAVVTIVHPLAENPRTPPKPRKGQTRGNAPETPDTAPQAAAWLASPHEGVQTNAIREQIERWALEPRWIDTEGPNS